MTTSKQTENYRTASNTVATTVTPGRTLPRRNMLRDYLLVWLGSDGHTNKNNDSQYTSTQVRTILNDMNFFTNSDEAIRFITDFEDTKVILVLENILDEHIISSIHNIPHIREIHIICDNQVQNQQWAIQWKKVKGIHTNIQKICESVQRTVKQYNQDSISVSFVTLDQESSVDILHQLEPSFMYTQIFKQIALEMKYDERAIKDFIAFCRTTELSLQHIDNFEQEYPSPSPIFWYSKELFIYSLLNRALRTMQADGIIKMGFLIHDLHYQIENLHRKETDAHHGQPFIVYRGQGLSREEFNKLMKTKHGLISFNNFLSTTKTKATANLFAESASQNTALVGVLFVMSIGSRDPIVPFAAVQEHSFFPEEDEILFSMHTVFRIGEITSMDDASDRLYQVELELTSDDDEQLRVLTTQIAKEITGNTGWQKLGKLLLRIGQFDKSKDLYEKLLEQASDESEKMLYYDSLGETSYYQGVHVTAIQFYEKAIEIKEKTLSENHLDLAQSYIGIGLAYYSMGEHRKALSFYEKALKIHQKTLPENHPDLAASYNNIGMVYMNLGECSEALSFYEKALEIHQKTLPENHPSLANVYNNTAEIYIKMGEHLKALNYFKKAVEIFEKTLPTDHADLATSYNNIGSAHYSIGDYSKALTFLEKALEILQKALPKNHHNVATSLNNIGNAHYSMGDNSKALSFFEEALEIRQEALPRNHPALASSYNNIGAIYMKMQEHSKALLFLQKAHDIYQETLPENHPDLATSYNNMGVLYMNMSEYSEALSFHEKVREIYEKTLPVNHPSLATSCNNIGMVLGKMGDYLKAISFYEKAVEIHHKTRPENHPDLATFYNNIGDAYHSTGDYSKALSFFEKALEIRQKMLPKNHSSIQIAIESIEIVKKKLSLNPNQ